jgi:hypothetical protein
MQKLALFCDKNDNMFAKFFGENIFKIITSVPVGACEQAHSVAQSIFC